MADALVLDNSNSLQHLFNWSRGEGWQMSRDFICFRIRCDSASQPLRCICSERKKASANANVFVFNRHSYSIYQQQHIEFPQKPPEGDVALSHVDVP